MGELFRLRDHRVDAATPDPPAAAQELDEDELVVGAGLLCSVLPMVAWLGRAQATTSLTSAREDVLRSKLVWDPDIVDLVVQGLLSAKRRVESEEPCSASKKQERRRRRGAEPSTQGNEYYG